MNIATLTIEMAANVARLRQDMDNAASVVQSATAKMQKAAEIAGQALGVLGVGLSLTAFTGFIRNAIDTADALDEMSGRVGVGAKELSMLQLAYKQAGMGNEAMASSLAKLSREMADGNAGLRALGVNTRNADGSLRGTTAVLLDVADKFQGMEEGAAKTALAMEIFGKSGAEMVPLLSSGSEGIAEMTAMAEKLGLVIEDSTAAQAGKFNDTLELLGLGVQGVGSRIAAQLLPTLTGLTGAFLESMTSGDRLKGVADFLANSLKILFTIGVGGVEVFNSLGKSLGGGVAAILAVLRGDFAGAKRILDESKTDIEAGWSSAAKTISAAWNQQSSATVEAGAAMLKTNKDLLAAEKAREEAAKKAAAAAVKAAEEAKKKAEEGAKLAAGLLAQDSGLSNDFGEKWDKLSAAHAAGKISLQDLTLAQKELLEQQPLMKKAMEEAAKASQAAADARNKESDGIQAFMRAQEEAAAASLKSVKDRITSLQDEESAADLSRALNISLAEAVERVAIARLHERQAGFYENSDGWENLRREIEERTRLLGLIGRKDVREREERGWTDMWTSVDRTAHDVFTNIFDGGTNVFKKLGQTLKASVLDVLYQMTVRRWIINIGTSVLGSGFGTAANAATGSSALSGLGSLGSLGNLWTMGSNAVGAIGSALGFGSAAGTGLGLSASAGTGLSLASGGGGLGLSMSSTGLGMSAGSAGSGAIGGSLGSSLGGSAASSGGFMSSLSAAGPYLASAAAIYAIAKSLDDSGTYHTGGAAQYSAASGLSSGQSGAAYNIGFGRVEAGAETIAAVGTVAQGIGSALDAVALAFGKKAGYEVAAAFARDTSDDREWAAMRISQGGVDLANWNDKRDSKWAPREVADGEEGWKQFLGLAGQQMRDVLFSMDLPGWAETVLDAIGENPSIEQLSAALGQIGQAQAVFQSFGQYMTNFVNLADSAVTKLASASGGLGALTGNMAAFVDQFYSEQEKLAVNTANVRDALAKLGFELPTTREEYRAMVQANIALGDAGADTTAGLLALSGAVASILPATEAATGGVMAMTDTVKTMAATLDDYISRTTRDSTEADYIRGLAAVGNNAALARLGVPSYLHGSHADGLANVPFDGYVAELHKGERVLTAQDNQIFTRTYGGLGAGGQNQEVAILKALSQNLLQEVSMLRVEMQADVTHNAETARILRRVTPNRDSVSISTPNGAIEVATPKGKPLEVSTPAGQPLVVDLVPTA